MRKNILVYGWYNQGNIGDELFKEAFEFLFPDYDFVFTSRITLSLLENATAVFIGGGSFLFSPPNLADGVFPKLQNKMLFYIGVGTETAIHPIHIELLKRAQLIAIRNDPQLDMFKTLNNNVMCVPDIVYCLSELLQTSEPIQNSVLILPNMAVVPCWQDPHWKHVAWEYFKSEFAQFLDLLIEKKYTIKFLAMCQNVKIDDQWAAIEIINSMKYRHADYILNYKSTDIQSITSILSQYSAVITQRFHGIVLSEMASRPCLTISHHDKLNFGRSISYYGISKQQLNDSFFSMNKNFNEVLSIENNIFKELKKQVNNIIDG